MFMVHVRPRAAMTFLLPAAWTALALAVPIIALYLLRTRLRRRVVSTSLFWQQLSPQVYNTSLWRRLRRWLSLLLQLAFLALLAFALAQPLASWQSLQPASLVLVLDPSVSMRATDVAPSRWEAAIRGARERIRQMRAFDEAALVLASDPPRVLRPWTRGKRALLRALEEAQPLDRAADLRPALALGRNLAEGRGRGRVVLFSDGVWSDAPAAEAMRDVEAQWIGSHEPRNVGLTLFAARRSLAAPGEYQLTARVEMRGKEATQGSIEILRDGRLMDALPLSLEPGKPWEHTWDGRSGDAVRFEARLSGFPGDQLSADDAALAAVPAQQAVQVELIAPPNAFLDAALGSLHHVSWRRAERPGAAQPGVLYIFHRAAPPGDFAADAVVLIDPPAGGAWGELRGAIESPLVSEWQRESPLLRHVALDQIRLHAALEFLPPAGATVFAESFGKPLIFGKWDGAPRWLVLPFELESSDLVLRTAFPILLGNLIETLRPTDEASAASALPGPVETALTRTFAEPTSGSAPAAPPAAMGRGAWWSAFPLWWWAVAAGALWLLAEWWTFSRRITE
jgi:hypothetical protein